MNTIKEQTNPNLSTEPKPLADAAAHAAVAQQQQAKPTWFSFWLKNVPFAALHVSCVAAVFIYPDWLSLTLCAVLYFVRMFGITAGYHRYYSHRAYKTSRVFQFVLALLGCSALQKGPLWWAAHHRQHHRHTDQPEDPHSPLGRKFWWSHIGWIMSSEHDETDWKTVKDWSRYPELCWLNRNYWVPGLFLAALCWLIDGWSGVVWGFLVSTVLLYQSTFMVNSVCHLWGSRRYATADASRNNLWVALLTLGEGWHNNHHHYQSSARQGFFWWEIDVSYYLIRLMGFVGLVWDIRKPLVRNVAVAAEPTPPPVGTT